jgi:hypothetical protein
VTAEGPDTVVWTEDDLLALAERLDETGGLAAACGVYARAGHSIANHWPADRVAGLLERMADTGAAEACGRVLDAVAEAGGTYPASAAHVAGALAARGTQELAHRFLDRVVPRMPDDAVEALAMFLDAGRQDTLAVYALATAAAGRAPSAAIGYMDMLRRHADPAAADALILKVVTARPEQTAGLLDALRSKRRPADADRLLELVMDAGAQQCGAALLALWTAGADHEAAALMSALARHPLADIAHALAAPGQARPPGLAGLGTRMRSRSPHEFVTAITALRGQGHDAAADTLTILLMAAAAETVCAVALGLAEAGRPQDVVTLLERFAGQASPVEVATSIQWLDTVSRPGVRIVMWTVLAVRGDGGAVMQALRGGGHTEAVGRAVGELALTLPVSHLATVWAKMSAQGIPEAEGLLAAVARPDFAALCEALHRTGHHHLAYQLAERRAEFTP